MSFRNWLGKLSISSRSLAKYQQSVGFLKLFKGYSPLPLNVDLVLTMRCNYNCSFCVCKQDSNADIVSAFKEPELSPQEWIEIVKDIKTFFLGPNLNLLGGEPSIYKGYLDIATFIKQQGFRCSYTTNGTFLSRDAANVVSIGVDVIVVSIDGPRDIHNSIRGPGAFERAAEGIQAINELKKTQGKKSPQIFLSCTISGGSYRHLAEMVDIAEELGVNYVNFLHLQFSDRELGMHNIDVDYLIKEIAKVKDKAANGNGAVSINFYPHLKTDQIYTYYLQPSDQLGKGCISPWMRMVIMPNGKVIPCGDYVVGDLRGGEATIKNVWNSKAFRTFRAKLAKDGLFPECARCCRKQY